MQAVIVHLITETEIVCLQYSTVAHIGLGYTDTNAMGLPHKRFVFINLPNIQKTNYGRLTRVNLYH